MLQSGMDAALIQPVVAGLVLLAAASLVGYWPVMKLIQVYEAKHELKRGSAGFIRSISGWSVIALWLLTTWFCATIIGDWGATGDLDSALARAEIRFRILLEIVIAILESDS